MNDDSHRFPCAALVSLLCLLAVGGCSKKPSDADMKENIKRQGAAMGKAMLDHDYGTAVSFFYDDAVKAMGGRERLVRSIHQSDQEEAKKGITIRGVVIGEPTGLTESNGQYFAICPESLEMSAPGGTLRSESFLIALSRDGVTWKFLDGAGARDRENLKTILPNLPATLLFPEKHEPISTPVR